MNFSCSQGSAAPVTSCKKLIEAMGANWVLGLIDMALLSGHSGESAGEIAEKLTRVNVQRSWATVVVSRMPGHDWIAAAGTV